MEEKNNNTGYYFTVSENAMKMVESGEAVLSSGGIRRQDGTLIEMAKPVTLDRSIIDGSAPEDIKEKEISKIERDYQNNEIVIGQINELSHNSWLQYASMTQWYEMTSEGIQRTISGMNYISSQLESLTKKIDASEIHNTQIFITKSVNNLRSIIGLMETKNFNATVNYAYIVTCLDEINAFLTVQYDELAHNAGNTEMKLGSIYCLILPYAYVVRRYSSLFYYENEAFPSNFDTWNSIIERIAKGNVFRNELQYYLRTNTDLFLANSISLTQNASYALQKTTDYISFDRLFVQSHTKEEYLSLPSRIDNKYLERNDVQHIRNFYLIEPK